MKSRVVSLSIRVAVIPLSPTFSLISRDLACSPDVSGGGGDIGAVPVAMLLSAPHAEWLRAVANERIQWIDAHCSSEMVVRFRKAVSRFL